MGFLHLESQDPFRAGVLPGVGFVPLNAALAGELKYMAGSKIGEQQARPRIQREVAQRLKHAVAAVVGPLQRLCIQHAHEAGQPAAVRYVEAVAGVGGGQKKRVGR